ncbi:L-rhamnose mutarotase [uncultured Sunxiuqinia sp.]|uniref:L-rhamnose mutarotase n=1 Tax=uncultured Sunxiuqinia sp. TaxID=1573825 RepID=UPI002609A824|nr:L-rhamnose mutarotase [uncultured Sunxiuqinia sp.]
MRYLIVVFGILGSIYGCTGTYKNEPHQEVKVIRKGSVILLKPDKLDLYKDLHANPWKSVNEKLKECNIRNYSIFYRDGYLFSYLEYTGTNWEADMGKLAADSTILAWWKLTDPCQEPVPFARKGEWWADMEEVYHLD